MLSDEEKKAIEILGEFKKNGFHSLNLRYESRVSTTKHIENSIETILKLIEKQYKEIECLNVIYESYKEMVKENNYISKDEIKAKIKEYYEYDKRMQNKPDWHTTKYYEAKALEKLLEE